MVKLMKLIMQFEAAHVRKLVIKNKEMCRSSAKSLYGLVACGVMQGFVRCFLMDKFDDDYANIHIIIYHQNGFLLWFLGVWPR